MASPDVERLKRVVLALPDVTLRARWLRDFLAGFEHIEQARMLNALCEDGERSDPLARETILSVALLFAALGECHLVQQLRAAAETRHLWSLERLLRRAPEPPHERPADTLPVPDYGTGRTLTVGERKSLARSPNRRSFDKLLSDPHPLVIRQLLSNPRLTEDDVVRMVARRPARLEVLTAIAQNGRWLSRGKVRLAIILNPGSPSAIAMPLLAVCTRGELVEALHSADSSGVLRSTARELLEKRPPLRPGADLNLQ
ncbi:MAG TPA: hypothetical protein VGI10_27905 [Polyangiaceae bacterium]